MGDKPTHYLFAKPKNGQEGQSKIGAAWVGTSSAGVPFISLKLNAGVRISWDDPLWFTLWPADEGAPKE